MSIKTRWLLGVWLLAASIVSNGCAAAETEPEEEDPVGTEEQELATVPDCKSFDLDRLIAATHHGAPSYQCQVSRHLSRSSQPDDRWLRSLSDPAIRATPFRAVVNLRESSANGEDPIVRRYGMTPLDIPVRDMHAPTRDQIIQFLAFVTTPENQPTLVHCKAGQGRTGTFVAAYRMAVEGWSPNAAIAEARAFHVDDEQVAFLWRFAGTLESPEIRRFRAVR